MVRLAHPQRFAMVASVMVLLTAAAPVAAAPSEPDGSAASVELGSHDVVLSDLEIHVSDVHIVGPGLPDRSIDSARYTVDEATVTTDGFTATVGDRTIDVGEVTLTLDDVGVVLDDVSTGGPDR